MRFACILVRSGHTKLPKKCLFSGVDHGPENEQTLKQCVLNILTAAVPLKPVLFLLVSFENWKRLHPRKRYCFDLSAGWTKAGWVVEYV